MNLWLPMILVVAPMVLGRQIPDWPYEKLFKHADVIVIAKGASTVDAAADIKDKPRPSYYKGVVTTLDVVQLVKGEHKEKKLVVFHYRMNPKDYLIGNGPSFVQFHREKLNIDYPGVAASLAPPEYMLFLKRRADGRFECVSGQQDPDLSVKQMVQPLGPAR